MGSGIYGLVRPFQLREVFNPKLIPPTSDPLADAEHVIWEGKAPTDYVEGPPPDSTQFENEFREDKSKRESHKIRVENPDDPEQHVMVERVDKFVFRNDQTGTQQSFKFDWSE